MTDEDPKELLRQARNAESVARERLAEASRLTRLAYEVGSVDALHELVRLRVKEGNVVEAQWLLRNASHQSALPRDQSVTIAPDVAGPAWADNGSGNFDWPGAGMFTVIADDPARAAAALSRVAGELMLVDEHGTVYADIEEVEAVAERYSEEGRWDIPYTPNFVFDVRWSQFGAEVTVDTKGTMTAAMARSMAELIARALRENGVAAHVTGWRPELGGLMTAWNPAAPEAD